MSKENNDNPKLGHPAFDGPGIKVGSPEFEKMILGVMINKHNDPDEDFDLLEEGDK